MKQELGIYPDGLLEEMVFFADNDLEIDLLGGVAARKSIPSRCELRLGFMDGVEFEDIHISPAPFFARKSLQTLVVLDETHIFTFCDVSFLDELVQSHIRPTAHSRSTPGPFLVAIGGALYQPLLQRLLKILYVSWKACLTKTNLPLGFL